MLYLKCLELSFKKKIEAGPTQNNNNYDRHIQKPRKITVTLSFQNSNRPSYFNNNGFYQIDIPLNWTFDNNSLLHFVYLPNRKSRMPEVILATVYVKLPVLQG